MANANLVLKFRFTGNNEEQVKVAGRIRLDGRGLTVYDAETGRPQTIATASLESLAIRNIPHSAKPAALAIAV
jgi:hypothetical protein